MKIPSKPTRLRSVALEAINGNTELTMPDPRDPHLHGLGVHIEDRVMMLMLDIPQFHAIFWGSVRAGAVPIPVNTMVTSQDYEFYRNDSRARVLAVSEELLPVINEISGDPPYLRDLIVISEVEGAHIPFRQKYKGARALDRVRPGTTQEFNGENPTVSTP